MFVSKKDWTIHYTADPTQPRDEWLTIPSDGRPLNHVVAHDMEPGTIYYLCVTSPEDGIETPTFTVMTPSE